MPYLCVYACVLERKREREKELESKGGREGGRQRQGRCTDRERDGQTDRQTEMGKGREGEMWEDTEAEIGIIGMQTLLKKGVVLFSVRVHACTYSIHVHLH